MTNIISSKYMDFKEAKLKAGYTWNLIEEDIKEAKIEIERGLVETTFNLTLGHPSIPIQGIPAKVIVESKLDLKIELANPAKTTFESNEDIAVDITSLKEDLDAETISDANVDLNCGLDFIFDDKNENPIADVLHRHASHPIGLNVIKFEDPTPGSNKLENARPFLVFYLTAKENGPLLKGVKRRLYLTFVNTNKSHPLTITNIRVANTPMHMSLAMEYLLSPLSLCPLNLLISPLISPRHRL